MRGECACGCVCVMWGAWFTRVCTHGHACVDLCCYCAIDPKSTAASWRCSKRCGASCTEKQKQNTQCEHYSIRSASHLLSASRQVSSHQHLHHICCRRHVTCHHIYIHMVVDCEQAGCVRTPHHTLESSVTDGHACSAFMHTTLRDRQERNARAIDILLAVVEQFRPLTVCSGASI